MQFWSPSGGLEDDSYEHFDLSRENSWQIDDLVSYLAPLSWEN